MICCNFPPNISTNWRITQIIKPSLAPPNDNQKVKVKTRQFTWIPRSGCKFVEFYSTDVTQGDAGQSSVNIERWETGVRRGVSLSYIFYPILLIYMVALVRIHLLIVVSNTTRIQISQACPALSVLVIPKSEASGLRSSRDGLSLQFNVTQNRFQIVVRNKMSMICCWLWADTERWWRYPL